MGTGEKKDCDLGPMECEMTNNRYINMKPFLFDVERYDKCKCEWMPGILICSDTVSRKKK